MDAAIFAVVALTVIALIGNALRDADEKIDRLELVKLNAERIVQVANGYATKIIDYESEVGSTFMSTTVGDKTTAADYENENLIRQLQSDGTLLAQEACEDSSGTIVGLARRKYLPCEFAMGVIGGENNTASAEFERVALTTVPAGYTTGYSSIKGTIIIGSEAIDEPFEMYKGEENPDIRLADEIVQQANIMAVTEISSNVLSSPIISFESTEAGAIVIHIEMIKNNQLTVRSDGSVPYSGDQNFGDNGINQLNDIRFSSLYGATTSTNFGTVEPGGTAGNTQFRISADNRLILSAPSGITLNNDTVVNGALEAGASTLDSATVRNALSADSATVTNALSANSANITNTLMAGSVSANGDITSENARLNYQVVSRGNYLVGSNVANITCSDGSERIGVFPVALKTNSGKPMTSYAPNITYTANATNVHYNISVEDGTIEPASSNSYVYVEQWCE